MNNKLDIAIYIYNDLTMLDAVGPYKVLQNLKDVNIKFAAKKGLITADSGIMQLNAAYNVDEIENADILLIPFFSNPYQPL